MKSNVVVNENIINIDLYLDSNTLVYSIDEPKRQIKCIFIQAHHRRKKVRKATNIFW